MRDNRIGSFDTLRGMAALAVCLLHCTPVFGLQKLLPHAYLVVDFFFCLSGYILLERYKHLISAGGNGAGISFRQFSVIRLARLYPLYAVALVLGAGYTILRLATTDRLSGHLGLVEGSFATALFVLPYFDATKILHSESAAFPYVTQSWSLFWELIASGLFYYWARYGKVKTVIISSIIGFFAIIILASPGKDIDGGWQAFNFWMGGARALFSFSLGILVANTQMTQRYKKSVTGGKLLSFFGYLALAVSALYIMVDIESSVAMEMAIVSIAFPVMIAAFSTDNTVLLSNRFGKWLGEISYSVYLLHGTFAIITLTIISKLHFIHPGILTGVICVSCILITSTFVRKWIELPAQNWLKSKMARRATTDARKPVKTAGIGLADVGEP